MGRYANTLDRNPALDRALALDPNTTQTSRSEPPKVHKAVVRLGQEGVDGLVARYATGETAAALAGDIGLSKQTIIKLVKAAGVPLQKPRLTAQSAARAVELYSQGWSLARVGDELRCDPTTVRNALLKAGVSTRDANGRPRK